MVCGPGLYQPTAAKKSSAMKSYLCLHDALLPKDPIITAPAFWHNDVHEENIFVDLEDPTKIIGIIDWQSVDLLPLFDHNLDPAFIQYSGPIPATLERPELEDTSKMSHEERVKATKDYFDKSTVYCVPEDYSKKAASRLSWDRVPTNASVRSSYNRKAHLRVR